MTAVGFPRLPIAQTYVFVSQLRSSLLLQRRYMRSPWSGYRDIQASPEESMILVILPYYDISGARSIAPLPTVSRCYDAIAISLTIIPFYL